MILRPINGYGLIDVGDNRPPVRAYMKAKVVMAVAAMALLVATARFKSQSVVQLNDYLDYEEWPFFQ